jgi:hypothetical protein
MAIFLGNSLHPIDFTVEGALVGTVTNGVGSVELVFNPNTTTQPFVAFGGGTFLFTVDNDLVVAGAPPIALTGEITQIMTFSPEPGAAWLCAAGIAILAGRKILGRRRSAKS